jgi:signal transduction histidine kinase
MKLNVKIIGLVIMVMVLIAISTFTYHLSRSREEKLFNYAYRENTYISIQSILKNLERSNQRILEDNSAWDMMIDFVNKPDTTWARENLGSTRKTMDLDLLQVYNLKDELVWATYSPEASPSIPGVITKEMLNTIFKSNPICHFFEYTKDGLIEIYGSIVVTSVDLERKTPARGYLIFGKLWDKGVIKDLENSSNSFIDLHNVQAEVNSDLTHSIDRNSQEIAVYEKDFTGKEIARLDFVSKSLYKADVKLFNLFTLIPLILAILGVILFYILIRKWITEPVLTITQSLDNQDHEILSHISPGHREFHRIAHLVGEFFENKISLEKEVAERKKAEEKISNYAEELQGLNLNKDKFFSILAHDLKSPFHYLLGYSDLLRTEYSTLSEEDRKKFISVIHSNSQRLYNLLENLLEWSRIQTGKIEFEKEVFDLAKELKLAAETIKVSAMQKKISIKFMNIDQVMIHADRNMIRSAVHNILTNAIKYTPDGGQVSIETRLTGSTVEVDIRDSGIGMNSVEITKLFRIDVSFSRPGTNKEPGTGLGLILTREFVEKNGGSLYVESETDKGSLFRITLPLHKA